MRSRRTMPIAAWICTVFLGTLVVLFPAGPAGSAVRPEPSPAEPAPGAADPGEWALSALDATSLWSLAPAQGRGITIAVVDTGIDGQNPDLAGSVSYPAAPGQRDRSADSHGTEIAGLIAGRGRDGGPSAVQGLAPQARLIDIPVTSDPRYVTAGQIAGGIAAAARVGAQIINVSLSARAAAGSEGYERIHSAVAYALARGCLVVASVGPGGRDAVYPADIHGVVAVAATDRRGMPLSPLGGHGELAVYAPGDDLYSTNKQGRYAGGLSGNDFATAYVAAAAAVIWSADGGTAGQIAQAVVREVAPVSPPSPSGRGLLDPVLVMKDGLPPVSALPESPGQQEPAGFASPKQPGGTAAADGGSSPIRADLDLVIAIAALVVGLVLFCGLVMYLTNRRRPPDPPTPGSASRRMPFDWDLESQ